MSTRSLLSAGIAAGPAFLLVVLAQVLTRDGFDLRHHPISLLSLTDAGWVQITNFIVAGVLYALFAAGLAQVLAGGVGHKWVPRLVGVMAIGLVAGGVFVADPGMGYPAGTPDGVPTDLSWHGTLHAAAPPLSMLALVAAAIVMARRHRVGGEPGWALYTTLTALVTLVVPAVPHSDSMSWRIVAGLVAGFAWLTALGVRERRAALRPTVAGEPAYARS
jgi:hypothetical protein